MKLLALFLAFVLMLTAAVSGMSAVPKSAALHDETQPKAGCHGGPGGGGGPPPPPPTNSTS